MALQGQNQALFPQVMQLPSEISIPQLNTYPYCVHCMAFVTADLLLAHNNLYHSKMRHTCEPCGNRFKHQLDLEFHQARGHYKNVPMCLAALAWGDRLYEDVTPQQFHRLMRNDFYPPSGMIMVDAPEGFDYPPLSRATTDYLRRKEESVWWRRARRTLFR